jgi:hypothetical protein
MMGHVKNFAVGAAVVFGAVYLDKMLKEASGKPGALFKPDSFVVKHGAPIAGGVVFAGLKAFNIA